MRAALSGLGLALLAACAATPAPKDDPVVAAADDTVCVREARTGSSLPTTKCRSAEQRQAAQAGVTLVEEQRRNFKGMTTGK